MTQLGKTAMGVRGKLLLPTVATLVVVIIGLSIALVTVQRRLSTSMRQDIEKQLVAAIGRLAANCSSSRRISK